MKKLALAKETLKRLQDDQLDAVAGGEIYVTYTCFTAINGCATRVISRCISYCAHSCWE